MGASESKTDSIDVDVDVADAPVNKTDSTLYADKVGKEFASKQPEHEVTAADATELGALGVAPGVGPVYH